MRSPSAGTASHDANRVHFVAKAGQPTRRSRLRPRYRRQQTPTMQLVQAVQVLVHSRLVFERAERVVFTHATSSVSLGQDPTLLPSTSEPVYRPPHSLGAGATVAYATGIHDAYAILARIVGRPCVLRRSEICRWTATSRYQRHVISGLMMYQRRNENASNIIHTPS